MSPVVGEVGLEPEALTKIAGLLVLVCEARDDEPDATYVILVIGLAPETAPANVKSAAMFTAPSISTTSKLVVPSTSNVSAI